MIVIQPCWDCRHILITNARRHQTKACLDTEAKLFSVSNLPLIQTRYKFYTREGKRTFGHSTQAYHQLSKASSPKQALELSLQKLIFQSPIFLRSKIMLFENKEENRLNISLAINSCSFLFNNIMSCHKNIPNENGSILNKFLRS